MDLSAITLTQLRYLVAVDRHRSFRLAARDCHVSQPALSMQIQKLEESLGVCVFDRSAQPVLPTEQGAGLIDQARRVLRECERLADLARERRDELSGEYRLGVLPTLGPSVVPRLLPQFLRLHPKVELVVEEVQTDALITRLQNDRLDGGIAVTPLGVPHLQEEVLCLEPFHVYLSPDHPLLDHATLRQSDLADQHPWILSEGHCFRTQVMHLCKIDRSRGSAVASMARLESGSFETLIHLVDRGLGLTVLPELVVNAMPEEKRRAQVRPFLPPVPVRQISFVRTREHLRQRTAAAMVEVCRSVLPLGLAEEVEVYSPIERAAN